MKRKPAKQLIIACPNCGHANTFMQPYKYHAGFSDQGFLYNEEGNCTLTWGSYDPAYVAVVGPNHPWSLTPKQRKKVESVLKRSPKGDRWLFANSARCLKCAHPISKPITEDIYFVLYERSVDVDPAAERRRGFKDVMK